jgi:hypothetical protein
MKYQEMKKYFIILALATSLIAGIIFTSYQSSTKRLVAAQTKLVEAAQTKLLYTKVELNTTVKDENSTAQNANNTNEWMAFKSEVELKIRDNEILITELKGEISEALYKKKVVYLEEQIRYMKANLINYEKSPNNWESFKRGFNFELDAIEKALKDLMLDNEK